MPGRYYPSNPNHRHGGGRPGGIPTNINVDKPSHLAVAGNPPSSTIPSHAHPHPHSLSPEAAALSRLRQKSISHPMQQCQLTIYVPNHTVGAVIGRGGRTILNVQREAMRRSAGHSAPVRISVLGTSNSNNNNIHANEHANQHEGVNESQVDSFRADQKVGQSSSTWNYHEYYKQQQKQQIQPSDDTTTEDSAKEEEDEWTPVVIRGDPVGCFSAVRQILPLVDCQSDIVFEVPIHRTKHNMLVGKGGIVIASLSATYETRIMIPPNEFMSHLGGGENFWKSRQTHHARNDAGSALLFGDSSMINGNSGGNLAMANPNINNHTPTGTLPPNVIQLEGDIDHVELCLVKVLGIVAGEERWTPTGAIVEKVEVDSSAGKKGTGPAHVTSDKGKDETTAEAVITKIWTPSSKSLNLGKIRKVQRKTNTIIRRKKLCFGGHQNDGSLLNEREEDVEEEAAESALVNENNDDEDVIPKEVSVTGPKTATKYIITGRTESVQSAAAQFEKILGLEPGSANITDTTNRTNLTADVVSIVKDIPPQSCSKQEGEQESGGVGPAGKKLRRKKKRGKGGNAPRGSKDGPLQNLAGDRGDV